MPEYLLSVKLNKLLLSLSEFCLVSKRVSPLSSSWTKRERKEKRKQYLFIHCLCDVQIIIPSHRKQKRHSSLEQAKFASLDGHPDSVFVEHQN